MTFDANAINEAAMGQATRVAEEIGQEILEIIQKYSETNKDVKDMALIGETSNPEMALRLTIMAVGGLVNGYPRLEGPSHKAFLTKVFLMSLGYEEIVL
ncbi:hypothetical protein EVC26_007 [Rhizobium phage RHph_I72]|nr:hypothetical protein EVC13_007 [Rhizobium phage RHph_I65]QIG76453.1 hypothetical protein EVC26_007 [Rhizobium phage RHph_I72]